MDKIAKAFTHKANIGYIVAGYPNLAHTSEFISNLDKSCIDLLEIGIPYSDPIADGKVIAEASFKAVSSGVNTDSVFDMLRQCKGKYSRAVVFLVYYNLIFSYGVENFIKTAKECGVSGMIVPDVPFEENEELFKLCQKYDFALIPLISVTSANRKKELLSRGSGFVYAIGAIGVSGSKKASNQRLQELVKDIKAISAMPVGVGFGVKNKEDADFVKTYADGAIIGTKIVELCDKFSGEEFRHEVAKLF
ncbi:MAG: tryptophan synthase subunit alpha [Campylobacter sp.]|nr:tryptophan synthase subunit alpha [Campylobacter sp.]